MISAFEIITAVLFFSLAFVFNSEMDTILEYRNNKNSKRKPWSLKESWWGYRSAEGFLYKTILSPFRDGWHKCKSAMVYCLSLPFTLHLLTYLNIDWYWAFLINVISFAYAGLIFELNYEN